jgi:hypothetical protein
LRILLAILLLAQAAPPQSEADRFEAAIKKFGERTYRITEEGKPLGTMSLKSRIEKEGDKTVAVLEDTVWLDLGPAKIELKLTETASLDGLKLIHAARTLDGKEEDFEVSASIRDGDAYVTVDRRHLIIREVRDVHGELGVLRLVGMKEQKVGSTFRAKVFVLESPSDELVHDFRCVSQETLGIGGKQVDAFKWEQKWKGKAIRAGASIDATVENTYWVAADGTLLRFKIGRNQMTLENK